MRILQVRFKNLNSLVGEWEIDMTHPAYVSEGIFAITGPTGSGKTTILDAICLALYGQTPRLNKITISGNELMSRQSGECFAEVTFETQAGCFRCHWSQHRARKKSDGELQPPKHEIVNAKTGVVIESKIRAVASQIEKATGMDFPRFTRSMLLAQGNFAAFLQATADERAPILEQITGTEIYSQLSIRVHELNRHEQEILKLLRAETAGITILEPEEEIRTNAELTLRQIEENEIATKSADTGKSITWLTAIDSLKKEIVKLDEDTNILHQDIEIFKPDLEKLNQALKAASFDGVYATLTATRKQQLSDSNDLTFIEQTLPGLELSAQEQGKLLQSAEEKKVQVKDELKAAADVLKTVRALDQTLATQKKTFLQDEDGCKKDVAKIDADKIDLNKEQEKNIKAQDSIEAINSYLKENAQDEWLISSLAGVEEKFNGLRSKQEEIAQKEVAQDLATKALALATKSLNDCQNKSRIQKLAFEKASNLVQQGNETMSELLGNRLLREYRAEKETLLREMGFYSKISELEDYRAKLEDGKPCELCGATEHPFATGNVPVPDEIEEKIKVLSTLIDKAESQEAVIKKHEVDEGKARIDSAEAVNKELLATREKNNSNSKLDELNLSLGNLRAGYAASRMDAFSNLNSLGITDTAETEIAKLIDTLKKRLKTWQAQLKSKADIESQIANINSELKRLAAVIETQNLALADKLKRLKVLQTEIESGSNQRIKLYGEKNPDEEENRLNKAINDADLTEKLARNYHHELQQKCNAAKTSVESLLNRIGQREPELGKLVSEFSKSVVLAGFSNEEMYLAAKLAPEFRELLAANARILSDREIECNTRKIDKATQLAAESVLNLTDRPLEELELQFNEYEQTLNELREAIAHHKFKLEENSTAKERIKNKQAAIEAQINECRRWGNLHELIGSSDGKKYRNFAQGLTFEMMIGHANRQLLKMTDRYLLTREGAQPLELNVVDNYQAGEIRSTKNLSGGEGFIVSLALALGLSNMASKNVRVDSLFLDEGFGTLDEHALETALETLAGLQQDGKIIGVISHVQALKERISTQIQVTPQSGGRSQISGPGCRSN